MSIRFATDDEITKWNDLVIVNPDGGNVFQGYEFALQKPLTGWTARYAIADAVAISIHEKFVFGLGRLWYIPKGPGVATVEQLGSLLKDLKPFAHQNNVFAIKIEPELVKNDETVADLLKFNLVPVRSIQPNFSTITVDISPDLETILTGLNQKGRHAIRRAERDGVTVKRVDSTPENCRTFYDLLNATAKGSFSIRAYEYYQIYWQRYAEAGLGQLFFAYVDGKIVAGAFALVFGHKSTYKDGASVRERTAYGASHLLQWHVMQWAKEKGSLIHDLCSTPPSDQINNEQHKWYGVGRFKTSFNKHVTDYVGAYDLPVRPLQYKLWSKFGERIILRLYWRKYHESWY